MALALLAAWRRQDDLRLAPLLVVVAGFQLALLLVHLHLGIQGDVDPREVYRHDGNDLLDGRYPESPYPSGAVLLFALDALLGGGPTRAAHGFVMVPFQVVLVAAVWSLRTSTSAWLAAFVGLWPALIFFWEYRFDLVPAALLAFGLVCAYRERWRAAAVVLAVGTWVKWMPAAAATGLFAGLVGKDGRSRQASTFAVTFGLAFVALTLPFLVWDADAVVSTYTDQGGRGVTAESLPYLPLRALGLARVNDSGFFWDPADRPGWADGAALAFQALAVTATLVVCVLARTREALVAVAALVPAVFLLTNRVFSPQFAVVIVAGWAVAGALLCRTRRDQLLLGATVAAATGAQALVFPARVEIWPLASTVWFALALGITAALLVLAARDGRSPAPATAGAAAAGSSLGRRWTARRPGAGAARPR